MAFVGGRRRRSHRRRATRSRLGKAFSGVESGFGAVLGTVGLRKPVNAVARTVRLSRGGSKCPYSMGGKRRRRRTRKHKRKCH
jgi:hypothetical protein